MASPMKVVYNKKSVPKVVRLTIQAELVQFAGIIVNNDLRCFLKSMAENVKGMSWRFTALHDFKPITYAMGAKDSEDAG